MFMKMLVKLINNVSKINEWLDSKVNNKISTMKQMFIFINRNAFHISVNRKPMTKLRLEKNQSC